MAETREQPQPVKVELCSPWCIDVTDVPTRSALQWSQALRVIACGALASVCCGGPAAPTVVGTLDLSMPAKRVLVVTHTSGFRHPSIPIAEDVLRNVGADSRVFTTTFCRDAADVARLITPAALTTVDAVVFANTTGNLGIADLPGFLSWIRGGGAFIGTHSASDTYHDAPEYLDMLGAEFDTHGDETTVDITVEDRAHAAGAPLPSPFRIFDEIYEFRTNPRGRVNVLFSLDRHPNDGHAAAGQPGDFPLAWYRQYGSGRVFYTALGHRDDVWTDRRFQQHLLGAIRWALGGN